MEFIDIEGQNSVSLNFRLKPQDSFGGFGNFSSRSSESTPNHQKAPLNPPAIVLNDM